MINTDSVESLSNSLPSGSHDVERALMLKMRLSDAISPATASLAQRGYLGCLPFAHDERDEIVLRLLPERDLDDSPVAIAWWSVTEGMTIAPDLSRFVAGRLAQTDMADPDRKISDSTRARLIKFAAEFGDKSSTESLLDSVDEVRSIKDSSVRAGKLWEVACPDDPLCKALAGAWTHRRKEVGDWLKQAMREISDVEIVLRLYVTYHVIYQTGTDVTEEAWKLVAADDVFDPTYTGASYGPTKGAWLSEALTYAIRWLQEQKRLDPQRTQSELWKAAQAYEDSENYDGSEHLAAARKLATENPALAYTHAANAAAFYARETEKTPIEAIIFAHELALANDWKNLSTVLEWTRAEIGI